MCVGVCVVTCALLTAVSQVLNMFYAHSDDAWDRIFFIASRIYGAVFALLAMVVELLEFECFRRLVANQEWASKGEAWSQYWLLRGLLYAL